MEFGYSSSASSSPSQQSSAMQPVYDTTSESSVPTSPNDVQQMMSFSSVPSYDFYPYQDSSDIYPTETIRIPVEFTGAGTLDEHDRRKRGKGNTAKDKNQVPNMHLRRRAQNRASQRAFRERKEKHVKGLEHQLDDLHDKHQDLLQSYNKQTDEMTNLNARMHELTSELELLRSSDQASFGEMLVPDKFDAVPSSNNAIYTGPDFYFDRGAVDLSNVSQIDDLL